MINSFENLSIKNIFTQENISMKKIFLLLMIWGMTLFAQQGTLSTSNIYTHKDSLRQWTVAGANTRGYFSFPKQTKSVHIWFDGGATDTMYISESSTFPDSTTICLLGGKELHDYFAWKKIYIKGSDSTKTYRITGRY